jgi:acyl-coenzyme A thioesterase PaaI-like protein
MNIMEHRVVKKQCNYRDCIVCGVDNKLGLHAAFYEMDNGKLVALTAGRNEHQSYPERMHGGIIAALLDEAIGRAILIHETIWGVTMNLSVKYRKPVPLDKPLKIVAEITENNAHTFKGTAQMFDGSGLLLAESEALYYKIAYDQMEHLLEHMQMVEDSITEIDC